MKRIMIAASTLALILTACGGSEHDASPEPTPTPTACATPGGIWAVTLTYGTATASGCAGLTGQSSDRLSIAVNGSAFALSDPAGTGTGAWDAATCHGTASISTTRQIGTNASGDAVIGAIATAYDLTFTATSVTGTVTISEAIAGMVVPGYPCSVPVTITGTPAQ